MQGIITVVECAVECAVDSGASSGSILGFGANARIENAGRSFTFANLLCGALIVFLAICWFGGLEYRALFKPDEGRYAEISLAMVETGDWITPRLNGLKYFEKPPLQYWATALAYKTFGPDEWTARLWTATLGFCGIFFSAWAARRLWPQQDRMVTVLLLVSSWGYFAGSQILTLDMGLSFFLSVAVWGFLLAMRALPGSGVERNWMLFVWAAMALAVLSKGLIGIVLPGLSIGAYAVVQRDSSLFKRLHWLWGIALFLIIAAPWFVLVQRANPEFFNFFFVREHFQRYALPDHDRPGPWWYFVVVLALGMLPWTSLIPRAFRAAWNTSVAGFNADRFLVLWIFTVLIFFSLSKSKMPAYVLPVLPAIALLMARHWNEFPARVRLEPLVLSALAALFLGILGLGLGRMPFVSPVRDFIGAYQAWICVAALVLTAGVCVAWRVRHRQRLYVAALACSSLLALQCAFSGMHSMDEYYSAERLFDRMAAERIPFAPGAPFYSVGSFDHSVPFYLRRPVTLVAYKGEMEPGLAAEPGKSIADIPSFRKRWLEGRQAYAIMPIDEYTRLSQAGLPMRVLERDVRRIVVARI